MTVHLHTLNTFYHHRHSQIYNVKRSTVNVYKIDSERSVRIRTQDRLVTLKKIPRLTGRSVRGRYIRVNGSFPTFSLTAGGMSWMGRGIVHCPGRNVRDKYVRGENVQWKCPTLFWQYFEREFPEERVGFRTGHRIIDLLFTNQ